MIFKTFDDSNENINEINKYVKEGKKVFILIFMHGCGPCNVTRPEWDKIQKELENKYKNDNNIVIVDVNKDYLNDLKFVGNVDGFPTIKYISDYGNNVENYESNRTVESFIEWIESKMNNQSGGLKNNIKKSNRSIYDIIKRLSKKTKTNKNKSRKNKRKGKSRKNKRKGKSRKNKRK
jgi:thiol-disulfide isomerase/thioredoxin